MPLDLVIARRIDDRGAIMLLDLVAADGRDLPPFEAGAHVEVEIPAAGAAKPMLRQYSLCGDPAERNRYRLGVLLDPQSRGGSAALHSQAAVGQPLRVAEPRNLFPLDSAAELSILVGGGIGVTPILAMAHALHGQGKAFVLHYCTRSPNRTAFLDELDSLPFRDRIILHHDDAPEGERFLPARDLAPVRPGTHLYVCGPTGFMDWVIAEARKSGFAEPQIHREYFTADVDSSGGGFEVVAAKSGMTIQVEEGTPIVVALAKAGIEVTTSCEKGICGSCVVDVLEGTPDHRDSFLTEDERAEGDQILVCCSRSKGPRLVLDI